MNFHNTWEGGDDDTDSESEADDHEDSDEEVTQFNEDFETQVTPFLNPQLIES